jgi:protein tyrosine/serine phosphatase
MTIASQVAHRLRQLGVVIFVALLLGGAYVGSLRLTGNFNPVVDGEVYRSAQLSPVEISTFAKAYGIKTIINLRGANPGKAWYDGEVAEARELGVAHLDFRMSARRELTATQAAELVALMKQAEKPLLIHCQAGADRSGLAAALYLAVVKKESPAEAAGQLSFRYGHFSLPFVPEYAMDRSFETLRPSLAALAQ